MCLPNHYQGQRIQTSIKPPINVLTIISFIFFSTLQLQYSLVKGDLTNGEVSLKGTWLGKHFSAMKFTRLKGTLGNIAPRQRGWCFQRKRFKIIDHNANPFLISPYS